jgi:phospholipid/cholesterol/gamma-HCH transport system permease protein
MARTPGLAGARATFEETGAMARFTARTVVALPRSTRFAAEVFRQLAILVRSSTLLIALMVAFVGFSATNYGYYFLRAAGAADFIGLVPGVTGPRLLAPLLFGYAFAAKVGCGLASEIGSMKINEELDAYDVEGVTTQRYVIGTRVLASLLFVPVVTPVALVGATAGAYLGGVTMLHAVPSETFLRFNWANQSISDQVFALAVIAALAATIVCVSCFYGMRTSGGPAGVGTSVSRSLMVNLVLVHVIIGLGDIMIYGTNLGLPIGG